MESPGQPSIDAKELAKMEKEEEAEEVTIDKNLSIVPIPPTLVWEAKQALFETRLDECESMVKPYASSNLWAMALYAEAAMWRFGGKRLASRKCLFHKLTSSFQKVLV